MKWLALALCSVGTLASFDAWAAQPRWKGWLGNRPSPIVQVVARGCSRLQEDDSPASRARGTSATVSRVGTGFLYTVGQHTHVITARHVVMGCAGGVLIRLLQSEQVLLEAAATLPASLRGCHSGGDFAVLNLPNRAWPPALPARRPAPEAHLEQVGIPWGTGHSQSTVLGAGPMARLDTLVNADQLPAFQALGSPRAETQLYRLDGPVRRGESGGPLLTWYQQRPFVAGMTLAQTESLSFYLPIDFIDAEIGNVSVSQCAVPQEVDTRLPFAAGTLPHVTESSDEPCKLGVAQMLGQHLMHEDLFDTFKGRAKAFRDIRAKLGPSDQEQTFSRFVFDGVELVVPEPPDAEPVARLFTNGCRISFRARPAHGPQAYLAELVLTSLDEPSPPNDLFQLSHWKPTTPLWRNAPTSFTLDQVDRVQADSPAFTETLAFVASRASVGAQLHYLAKWDPANTWKRACYAYNPLHTEAERKSCIRERLDFIAFIEALQLLTSPEVTNSVPDTSASPLNQLPPAPVNQLR